MRDSTKRNLPAIHPDTPLTPNERKAIASDAARKALKIKENQKVLDEYFESTLPRMIRILGMADEVSERLTRNKLDVPSRKEK